MNILGPDSPPYALHERIALQEQIITGMLSKFDRRSATFAWLETIRAIEETVNLITVDWEEEFAATLFAFPILQLVSSAAHLQRIRAGLAKRFDDKFVARFVSLMLQFSALGTSLQQQGQPQLASSFTTLGTLIGYLQSRRRACVALLHRLPDACIGDVAVGTLDPVVVFFPVIEFHANPLTAARNALLIRTATDRLAIEDRNTVEYASLDDLFLEPERSRITEMDLDQKGLSMLAQAEKLRPDCLFSAAELRNDMLLLEAAYSEFDLSRTKFGRAAAIIRNISRNFVDRDFWVKIPAMDLNKLVRRMEISPDLQEALVFRGTSYSESIDTYAPLIHVDGVFYSTVTLLSRFAYYWRAKTLDKIKRFQIRSGFIFEKAVANELRDQGFEIKDIKRIDRHEFDVIAVGDGVVWNVQCKNNFLDLAYVEASPARFARYNHRLVRSYERALEKDRRREHVLAGRSVSGEIQHVVVSRYPVICSNPRILPFSLIREFRQRMSAVRKPPA
ncbi:hypothetical protein FHX15_003666 [Rhizobium sp. BK650]|uniref:hypothetical protein n=1 Tax=Rhizobium sp. BK650 TaxID=2586990 RepID=UPI001608D5E0|nr:hypothetical protein [Rhizobium sp. BK650]MBB3658419.1 hypothetical protein [Rhizobium sp. BK650]